jgi:signal transduction histidine kinase
LSEFADLIEIPRFARPNPDGPPFQRRPEPDRPNPDRPRLFRPAEWVLIQLDLDYIRNTVLPDLLQRDLGSDYQTQVVMAEKPSEFIFKRDGGAGAIGSADGSIRFFELRPELMMPRFGGGGGRRRMTMGPVLSMGAPDRGRWMLTVRHRAGSLDAVVSQARTRNLAVTTGLFALLVAAMAALVQFTRRSQKLAELQMEFVAGVSHELRTPLSVMRTAGHNLRGKVAADPVRVQRYGELIEEESEKLTAIVEQVLRFANVKVGRVIGVTEPVSVESLIDAAVQADRKLIDQSGCILERRIAPELPPVQGDPTTLKHALRNLLSNAAKYGRSGDWIGVSAALEPTGKVEIRIADHGPGIPADEVNRIFDPFYRGKSAVQDQIHGTGLGLSLAKRIIEAHDGTIAVQTEPGKGTEFIVLIPAAVQESAA